MDMNNNTKKQQKTQIQPPNIIDDDDDIRFLKPKYDYYQSQIVKPQQFFLISKYFLEYWLHKLGPKMAWIYIILQQTCWLIQQVQGKTKGSQAIICQISQKAIAKKIGMERHAISNAIRTNKWVNWVILKVEKQWGWVIGENQYYRPATAYTLQMDIPLVPEHLKGLYAYFKGDAKATYATIKTKINALLGSNDDKRDILHFLENLSQETEIEFDRPHTIAEIIELATGFTIRELGLKKAREMDTLFYELHTYLTDLGGVMCTQYFRLNWVPLLKPALAWLVMILKSRCYYNPKTGETRDTYRWKKQDLAKMLGQTWRNIKNLLNKPHAQEFIELLNEDDKQKWSMTIKVLMDREPLTPESLIEYNEMLLDEQGITPEQQKILLDEPVKTVKKETVDESNNPAVLEWKQILQQLQGQMTEATFKTWLVDSKGIEHKGKAFLVEVKNKYAKDWLENRLKSIIERTASNVLGQPVQVTFKTPRIDDG